MEIRNLSLTLEKNDILKDVSFSIENGKMNVLLGPNGSGKTSLLFSMLDLYKKRYQGDILFDGQSIHSLSSRELAKRVAFHFQMKHIPDSYVSDLLELARTPYSSFFGGLGDKDFEIIQHAVRLCGIENILARNMKTLSGGERQMVYVALTIIQDSELLIFDEPDTYLDVKNKKKVFQILEELKKEGKTILLTLHDFNLAYAYGDNFFILEDGKLVDSFTKESFDERNTMARVFSISKTEIEVDGEKKIIFY